MSRNRKLTARQLRFFEEYIKCWNATKAARIAGYSARSAGIIGFATKRNPKIKAMIEAELDRRRAEIHQGIAERASGRIKPTKGSRQPRRSR